MKFDKVIEITKLTISKIPDFIRFLIRNHIAVVLFLSLFSFVITMNLYRSEIPGNVFFTKQLSKENLSFEFSTELREENNSYRITSYYEYNDGATIEPSLFVSVKSNSNTVIEESLSSTSGTGGRDQYGYLGKGDYGIFTIPQTDVYRIKVTADYYPDDYRMFFVEISDNASNELRNRFALIGAILFILFIILWRREKRKAT